MSDYYNDTLDFLENQGILTEFPNLKIYIMEEPDETTEQMLTLIPTGGFSDDPGESSVEYPGIQFLVRDVSSTKCFEILRWIKKTLTNTSETSLKTAFEEYKTWALLPNTFDSWTKWSNRTSNIIGFDNTSSMISLGKDNKNRFRVSDNYIIYNIEEV